MATNEGWIQGEEGAYEVIALFAQDHEQPPSAGSPETPSSLGDEDE